MAKLPANRRKTYFTPEQLHAIELLSEPKKGGLSFEEVAQQVGVSRRTLFDWRCNEFFLEEVKKRSTQKLGEHTPEIYDILLQEFRKNPNAKLAEVLLKTQGLLQPDSVSQTNVDVRVNDRSNETIQADIERLRRELGKDKVIDIDSVEEDEE